MRNRTKEEGEKEKTKAEEGVGERIEKKEKGGSRKGRRRTEK